LLGRASASSTSENWPYVVGPVVVGGARILSDDFRAILEYEHGTMYFGDLADFTGYRYTADGQLDAERTYRYKLSDEPMNGFRLGLRFRGQLDFVWSRLWASSGYQVWLDGEPVQNSEPGSPLKVELPAVDVRMDMLTLAWRVKSVEESAISPTLRIGYGWTLLSQQGSFQAPFRPPVDDSQSDDTFELAAGVEGKWKLVQAGMELRGFTFRWDSEDANVPSSQVWNWMWSLRVGLVF
jgi:hypothetical protein